MEYTENQLKIFQRYFKRDSKGNIIETPESMFKRVAKNIALSDLLYENFNEKIFENVEYDKDLKLLHKNSDKKERDNNFKIYLSNLYNLAEKNGKAIVENTEKEFYDLMANLEFLPNSPTLMNAGMDLQQLSACYVLPVEDSIEGWMKAATNAAIVHKTGGGTGFSVSRVRSEGKLVSTTKGIASGPLSPLLIINEVTQQIKQGGKRRGANMGILNYNHPNIEDFIKIKEDGKTLQNFNISVGVDEKYFKLIENDGEIELIDPHTKEVTKKIKAKELFKKQIELAWKTGDPGWINLELINKSKSNPVPYLSEIESTNPCVTADTWIMTDGGARQVKDLIGINFTAIINGKEWKSPKGFFKTGKKRVYKLATKEGFEICLTKDHPLLKVIKSTRDNIKIKWANISEIKKGDKLLLNNHKLCKWKGNDLQEQGYLIGLLIGDGTLQPNRAILAVWGNSKGPKAIRKAAQKIIHNLGYALPSRVWRYIPNRKQYNFSLSGMKELCDKLCLKYKFKTITKEIEQTSFLFYKGLLRGLFDTDGSVQGTQLKGISVRLAQSNLELLKSVQRMLLRLGIYSTIYQNRRKKGKHKLPDGKGGYKYYNIKAQHELIISNENLLAYHKNIGFMDIEKNKKLEKRLKKYVRKLNKEKFIVIVKKISFGGIEEVYDVKIPGINAFDANGFLVHNCGEQPLLPYESCNLGSINLTKIVKDKKIDYEKLEDIIKKAVHFLDNVIDVNNYPLPEIEKISKSNRRIGLGVMGFNDMLVMLNISYNSEQALKTAEELMKFIKEKAHNTSIDLAKKRGVFPNFKNSIYDKESKYFCGENELLRNAAVTTIAPTGTIGLVAGVEAQGIEPFYNVLYTRYTAEGLEALKAKRELKKEHKLYFFNSLFENVAKENNYFGLTKEKMIEKIENNNFSVVGIKEIPENIQQLFLGAHDINYEQHIKIQAAFQKYVDNAVSKTINLKNDAKIEDIENAYLLAHKLGCKGITVYRDGSKDQQVLNTNALETILKKERPEILEGITEKIKTGDGTLYITINEIDGKPFEIFTQIGKSGYTLMGFSEAVARLISLALRSGVAVNEIIDQLSGIGGANQILTQDGLITSVPDAIAKVLEKYYGKKKEKIQDIGLEFCPECNNKLTKTEGCLTCLSCGFSKC